MTTLNLSKRPKARIIHYLLHCLIYLALSVNGAPARLTEGYVGTHWLFNPSRHEVLYLTFNGAQRGLTSIDGFQDGSILAFHPDKNYGWATNHVQFGPLVKLLPAKKDIRPIRGIDSPVALTLSFPDEHVWVLESKTNEVVYLSAAGSILARFAGLPKAHVLDASPKDLSVWVGCENFLIKLSREGKYIAKTAIDVPLLSMSADLHDGGCWAVMKTRNELIKFSAIGEAMFRVPFENPKTISTAPDSGGCWVVDGNESVFVTQTGKKSDVVKGYEEITAISRNLSDGTFWLTDLGGDRLSKLPHDENEAVLAVIGLHHRTDNKQLRMARHIPIRRVQEESAVTPEPERVEVSPADVPPPSSPTPDVLELEVNESGAPNSESESPEVLDQTNIKDKTAPALQISEIENPSQAEISRLPPLPKLPDKEFPGIVFIELSAGLSQKRLKNTDTVFGRRYAWNFDGETYTLLLGLDVETYNAYDANQDRLPHYREIIRAEVPVTQKIATAFHNFATKSSWNGEKLASFVLAFVQSLPYTVDKVTTGYDEFIAYAYETLVAGGGDCEDTTILAVSILIGLGYDVVLLNPPGHLAFGVAGNYGGTYLEHEMKRYFYCESTGTGWRVGQIPDVYRTAQFTILPIVEGNR